MKKYFLYIILLVALAIFTAFVTEVGVTTTYKQMENSGSDISQVSIFQAESTKANGRIRGMINNNKDHPVEGNYIKFEFYSQRDVNMGNRYIEVDKTQENHLNFITLYLNKNYL